MFTVQPHKQNILADDTGRTSTLTLFVLGILADDPDASLSLDDLAFLADRLY